jgi:hypothetical protein
MTGHVAPAKPAKTGKLYILQYYDQASYDNQASGLNNSPRTDSSIRNGESDPYRILDLPEPGPYAIFIEISRTKTFLYIPETDDSPSASPDPVSPSRYSIACYVNTRPELRGDLIEGFVGDRDIRIEDVGKVRGVVQGLKMKMGMESFDWARGILTVCEEHGLLRGSVSSCL